MYKIGVIMLGGDKQNICFWPSYYSCEAGINHDLIVVHRNMLGTPESINNKNGNVILENKIINGFDVPHKAFGAYKFFFEKYKDQYDYFIFISDDVIIKRDNWLLDIINSLNLDDKIGFGASQIFNGGTKYPHESHIRAPFWFAKTKALKETIWNFESDHDGEMKIGDQISNAGYLGIQVGNKISLGFDVLETNHITQLLEQKYFPNKFPNGKYSLNEQDYFSENENYLIDDFILSPYYHIGQQNIIKDLQPFDLLLYLPNNRSNIKHEFLKYNRNIKQ